MSTYLEDLVTSHSERQVGNGLIPVPAGVARIIGMYVNEGKTIPEIAEERGIEIADVMATLGVSYYCSECGMGADLSQGVSADYCTGGDRSAGFLSTSCCQGWHLDRNGVEYIGDSPFREEL